MDYLSETEYREGVDLINRIETTLDKGLLDNLEFNRNLDMIHTVLQQLANLNFVPFSKLKKIQKNLNDTYFGLNSLSNDFKKTTRSQWEFILEELTPYIIKAEKRVIPIKLETFKESFANEVLKLIDTLNEYKIPFDLGEYTITIPLGLYSKQFVDSDGYYYVFNIELGRDTFEISLLLSSDKEGYDIEFESDYFGFDGFIHENKESEVWEHLNHFIMKIKYGN